MRRDLRDAFEAKVERIPFHSCWEWAGTRNRGYGRLSHGTGAALQAHRVAYELYVGEIPAGLHIDHLCRNRSCVNPAHLEPVTNTENVMRGVGFGPSNAARTHCKNGHELVGDNLKIRYRTNGRPYRLCQTCIDAWQAQSDRKRPLRYVRKGRSGSEGGER